MIARMNRATSDFTAAPQSSPSSAETEVPTQCRPTILLVDDDRLILATLSEGLRAQGYSVLSASSSEQAMELLQAGGRACAVNLAILDVRMPMVDGIAFAKRMREIGDVPFMFLSAYADHELAQAAAQCGAMGYLVKPVDVPQLVPAIESALARWGEIAALKGTQVQLTSALAIEQKTRTAVGVIIERHGVDRIEAFELLRQRARTQRRKIAELADEIIASSELLNEIKPKPGGRNRSE